MSQSVRSSRTATSLSARRTRYSFAIRRASRSHQEGPVAALGAEIHEPVKDVGGGIKVASVRDPFGNLFSIIENPHFKLDEVR